MFVAEKNSIWYFTMPKGILFMGNRLSFDPSLFEAMHRANLYIKLFLLFSCNLFIECIASSVKFAGLELIPLFNASSRKTRLARSANSALSKPAVKVLRFNRPLDSASCTSLCPSQRVCVTLSTTFTGVLFSLNN